LRKENTNLRETLSARPVGQKTSSNQEAEQDYQAAKTALSSKNMETALNKFKEALLLDPDNSKYATDYSIALAEDHQYAEAIDTLRRYLQRNPGDRDVYNQLGKIYLLNDQADAANQAFTRAIPISVLNNYATSLKKLGNMSEAESVFKMALAMNPKDSEVLFNLGNLYNAENKLEQARNKYLEALQVRPEFAEAHYNLGLIFAKLGDKPKAISHLERFLQLSPNARNAETIRGYLQSLKA
jgi:tetratricopeptide (TPR) repeat protein